MKYSEVSVNSASKCRVDLLKFFCALKKNQMSGV